MTTRPRTIRIFISSPGDVADERDKARRVIERLQRHYTGATLQAVLWQDLALPATATFQETIDIILMSKPIDIAVFILWSRLGTPPGPPTARPDGTSYRSGTEREFDLMLSAFAQSGKKRPVILAYLRDDKDDADFHKELSKHPRDEWEEMIAQQKLAESFKCEQFRDDNGRPIRAYSPYREPVNFADLLEIHLRQPLEELLGVDDAARWLNEPYRGLEFFDVSHAKIFYGRDEEICDLKQRLRDQRHAGCEFVVIVGASGSGKSSLARAGVAASLTQHSFEIGVKEWRAVVFIPGLSRSDLCTGLVRAMAEQLPELRSTATALDDIAGGLAKDPELTVKLSVTPAFARAAEHGNGAIRVLLVLDQMEELWTDRRLPADIERFLDAVEALARSGHIAVLATLRSDFYSQAQGVPPFLRLKGDRGHCDLLPPGTAALQRLITEPARLAGLRFERNERSGKTLDEVILQDASYDSSALPLLQYTLSELYHARDESTRTLTFAAYEKLGGVEGALGRRAADTFNRLSDEARQTLPEILPLLVTVDIVGEQTAVRRRAPLADLIATPARKILTESLIAARFLTTDRQDETPIASLAHEALLRRWEQLADWVTANREHLRLRVRAEQNQQRWEQQGRDTSLLLTPGLPLEEGRQLLADASTLLSTETAKYIRASITHHDLEQTRQRQRRRVVMAALSVLTVLALTGGTFAWIKQDEAEREKNEKSKLADQEKSARATADANARTARDEAERARRHLYTARMNFAQVAWEHNQVGRVLELLNKYEPQQGVEDLRGFEWYYWDRLCHSSLLDLKEHNGRVRSVEFSADGKRLASASEDETVKVWDATSGAVLLTLKGHTGVVNSVAFTADGTRLASASFDRTVKVWDATSGKEMLNLKGHAASVQSVAFSPDGKRLASASSDHTVKVWDATSGQETLTLRGHSRLVTSVAFGADGKWLASASDDGTVKIWDARPWTKELRDEREALSVIHFLRDQGKAKAEWVDAIADDQTMSEPVRERALQFARKWR